MGCDSVAKHGVLEAERERETVDEARHRCVVSWQSPVKRSDNSDSCLAHNNS